MMEDVGSFQTLKIHVSWTEPMSECGQQKTLGPALILERAALCKEAKSAMAGNCAELCFDLYVEIASIYSNPHKHRLVKSP